MTPPALAYQLSVDISCPHGAQQQTRRMPPPLLSTDGTDRLTDGRTDGQSAVAQTLLRMLCGQRLCVTRCVSVDNLLRNKSTKICNKSTTDLKQIEDLVEFERIVAASTQLVNYRYHYRYSSIQYRYLDIKYQCQYQYSKTALKYSSSTAQVRVERVASTRTQLERD